MVFRLRQPGFLSVACFWRSVAWPTNFFGITVALSATLPAALQSYRLFEGGPMPTFVLFIECDPVPAMPLRSIHVAARDAGEAECAADAIADFAFATVAQDVTIHIHDLATASEIKAIRRPVPIAM
jgi:hypothetical protein